MNLHARTHNVTYRTTWNYSTRAGDNHKAMPSADKMMNKSLLVEKAIQNWFTFNAMPSQTNHRTQLNPFTLFLRLLVSHCPLRCRLISKLNACIVHIHILYTEHTEHIHILCKIISVFSSHSHPLNTVNSIHWCAHNSNVMLLWLLLVGMKLKWCYDTMRYKSIY